MRRRTTDPPRRFTGRRWPARLSVPHGAAASSCRGRHPSRHEKQPALQHRLGDPCRHGSPTRASSCTGNRQPTGFQSGERERLDPRHLDGFFRWFCRRRSVSSNGAVDCLPTMRSASLISIIPSAVLVQVTSAYRCDRTLQADAGRRRRKPPVPPPRPGQLAAETGSAGSGTPPGPAVNVSGETGSCWPTPGLDQSHTPLLNTALSRACCAAEKVTPV